MSLEALGYLTSPASQCLGFRGRKRRTMIERAEQTTVDHSIQLLAFSTAKKGEEGGRVGEVIG